MEELAYRLWAAPEWVGVAIGLLTWPLGGIVGALTDKGTDEMRRMPYFLWSSIAYLGAAILAAIVSSAYVASIKGGYSWAVLVVNVGLIWGILGFIQVRWARARARDITGHPRLAFLHFVPLAQIYLMLAPARPDRRDGPPMGIVAAVLGVVFGLFVQITALGIVQVTTERFEENITELLLGPPETLNQVLWRMTVTMATLDYPVDIGSGISLLSFDVRGDVATSVLDMSNPAMKVDEAQVNALNCRDVAGPLALGLTTRDIYMRDGEVVAAVDTTAKHCE